MKKNNKKIFGIIMMTFLLVFVTGCEEQSFNFTDICVKCGDAYFPEALVILIRNLVEFVQLLVPIIIIIFGMIELVKAVIASDEKQMGEAKAALIRKFIVGIMIFLVIAIVKFGFGIVANVDKDGSILKCASYFVSTSIDYNIDTCPSRTNGSEVNTKDGTTNNSTGYEDTGVKDSIVKACADREHKNCSGNCEWTYANSGTGQCVAVNANKECKDFTSEKTCKNASNLSCTWYRDYNIANPGSCITK